MLASVDVGDIDSHKWIRKPVKQLVIFARQRRIRKGAMDDGYSHCGKQEAKAKREERKECIGRPDDTIAIAIEKRHVLLLRRMD